MASGRLVPGKVVEGKFGRVTPGMGVGRVTCGRLAGG
jgi:hypothetical protein